MFTCIECENKFDDLTGDTDVEVSGCFTVVAESQESANRFIRNQLEDGVSSYTCALEVGNE